MIGRFVDGILIVSELVGALCTHIERKITE